MKIAVVVGNPNPKSRTLKVAETVADRVADLLTGSTASTGSTGSTEAPERLIVDLADYAGRLFDWNDGEVQALNDAVAASDLVVVGSPTYKATYTGLLKAFLDRYQTNGLAGTVAIPVMTGGSDVHALGVEVSLRPLLVELGASVPTRGLYVVMSRLEQLDETADAWLTANASALRGALSAENT